MKRVSVATILQEIIVDLYVMTNEAFIVIKQTNSDELNIKHYELKEYFELFEKLKEHIHPRYTRVILDAGDFNHMLTKLIDKEYNNEVKMEYEILENVEINGLTFKVPKKIKIHEMLEMVEVKHWNKKALQDYKSIEFLWNSKGVVR